MWKSQKFPEPANPWFDFSGASREKKHNILDKKNTLVGINSSLYIAEGNISEHENIARKTT